MTTPHHEQQAARRGAEPIELQDRAFDNLRYIRETMDRTASFTAVSGLGHMLAGATAVGAAVLGSDREGSAWLWVWLLEALVGLVITVTMSVRKARRSRVPLTRGAGRRFLMSFAPPALAAVVLTPALIAADAFVTLPGMWLLLYGVATVSAGAFSVRVVPAMGLVLMVIGVLALSFPAARDLWLALGFGGVHIVFGWVIARRYGG